MTERIRETVSIVREETKILRSDTPVVGSITSVIRDEVQQALHTRQYAPTLTAMPTEVDPAPVTIDVPRHTLIPGGYTIQSEHAGFDIDYRRALMRKRDLWRTPDRRSLFYHCNEAGHIYRECLYQQLGLRGFSISSPRRQATLAYSTTFRSDGTETFTKRPSEKVKAAFFGGEVSGTQKRGRPPIDSVKAASSTRNKDLPPMKSPFKRSDKRSPAATSELDDRLGRGIARVKIRATTFVLIRIVSHARLLAPAHSRYGICEYDEMNNLRDRVVTFST
ncbi:hypothetical protein HPB50_000250 [Hyalomma asiaticum]|uniref:Uncharacterized protein n=1 Tax=Hyalomma asiaticum TaxID=266040 RepID=A0ACB7T9I2_HYAAI|nr:hypothetical protein HPB50_000250 [Hyalomma asiaticum]